MKPFFLSLVWLVLAFFFGLLQLWFLLTSQVVVPEIAIDYNQLLIGGTMLFFCSALVTSLSIDQFFAPERRYSMIVIGGLFALYPLVILLVTSFLFAFCFGKKPEELNMDFVRNLQITLLAMCALYAIVVKTLSFQSRG